MTSTREQMKQLAESREAVARKLYDEKICPKIYDKAKAGLSEVDFSIDLLSPALNEILAFHEFTVTKSRYYFKVSWY